MRRWKGAALLAGLTGLLALVVWVGSSVPTGKQTAPASASSSPPAEALLDAVFDRIGVTRWAEAIQWYEWETEGLLADAQGEDRPVWVARGSLMGPYHSVPLCGSTRSPVSMPLSEALAEGRVACPRCWQRGTE